MGNARATTKRDCLCGGASEHDSATHDSANSPGHDPWRGGEETGLACIASAKRVWRMAYSPHFGTAWYTLGTALVHPETSKKINGTRLWYTWYTLEKGCRGGGPGECRWA